MAKLGDIPTTDELASGGTLILNGSGPPADALGAVGNYYLDTVAKILYGPKAASGTYGPDQIALTTTPTGSGQAGVLTGGLKIKPLVAGRITGLRYYRIAANTAHSITLTIYLQSSQAELGRVTVNNVDSAPAGWVDGILSSPVIVAANTDYRLGYSASPTATQIASSASLAPSSAVPLVMTLNGNCYSSAISTYPATDINSCFHAGPIFQASAVWPVAIKSAP